MSSSVIGPWPTFVALDDTDSLLDLEQPVDEALPTQAELVLRFKRTQPNAGSPTPEVLDPLCAWPASEASRTPVALDRRFEGPASEASQTPAELARWSELAVGEASPTRAALGLQFGSAVAQVQVLQRRWGQTLGWSRPKGALPPGRSR
jgi:hypothetical protein